jgi:hypothetical protein
MHLSKTLLVLGALMTGGAGIRGTNAPRPTPFATSEPRELVVPGVDGMPALDGELDDRVWLGDVARTGPFIDGTGAPARPYSDARITWTRGYLLVGLYAADEDIRTVGAGRDAFRVTLGATTFEVSAAGELRGAPPGTLVGHEHDGTLDDRSDDDEEWVIELAIPLASLGLEAGRRERLRMQAQRCDTPRGSLRRCASSPDVMLKLAGQS